MDNGPRHPRRYLEDAGGASHLHHVDGALRSLGVTTMAIRGTTSTDHQSIDAIGIPRFSSSGTRSDRDSSSTTAATTCAARAAEDMMKNAAIAASFVYHAAVRDELLPRKPLPATAAAGGHR
jgi:hypothetical protein